MKHTVIETVADVIKHAIYGGVIVTLAWLALCAHIVAQTGSTAGIADVGLATTCLASAVITEPTATLAAMAHAGVDAQQADQLMSTCRSASSTSHDTSTRSASSVQLGF